MNEFRNFLHLLKSLKITIEDIAEELGIDEETS